MIKSRFSLLCQAIFKCQKKGYKTFEIVKKLLESAGSNYFKNDSTGSSASNYYKHKALTQDIRDSADYNNNSENIRSFIKETLDETKQYKIYNSFNIKNDVEFNFDKLVWSISCFFMFLLEYNDDYFKGSVASLYETELKNNNNINCQIDILDPDVDLAPEIKPNNLLNALIKEKPKMSIPQKVVYPYDELTDYLSNLYKDIDLTKTILYKNQLVPFYSIYEPNTLSRLIGEKKYDLPETNIVEIRKVSPYIIITGPGGIGKTMLMKHLVLNSIKNYDDYKYIPVLVNCRDYDGSMTIEDFILKNMNYHDKNIDYDEVLKYLDSQSMLLLFDGLDELKQVNRLDFEKDLDELIKSYPNNTYVITSRPYSSFLSFSKFSIINIAPFSKKQSVNLINKLKYRETENIKKTFIKEILNDEYWRYREFIENPLLLTLMLMTYGEYGTISDKESIFYQQIFDTLSFRHDNDKTSFARESKTNLTPNDFEKLFSELCARSYKDGNIDMDKNTFTNYFQNLNPIKNGTYNFTAQDFLDDLTDNLCIMYFDKGMYHFIHRSFQEFLSAFYISKQSAKNLYPACMSIFEGEKKSTDSTYKFLNQLIPNDFDIYITIPYLSELLERCNGKDGYKKFLEITRPIINYQNEETDGWISNAPSTLLLSHLEGTKINNYPMYDYFDDVFPFEEDFVTEEYIYGEVYIGDDPRTGDPVLEDKLMRRSEASSYSSDSSETVGWELQFNIEDIYERPDLYPEFYEIITKDDFILHKEFVEIQKLLNELIEERDKNSNDIFDILN